MRRPNIVRHLLRWLTSKSNFCASKHEHVQQYLMVKIEAIIFCCDNLVKLEFLGGIFVWHFRQAYCQAGLWQSW